MRLFANEVADYINKNTELKAEVIEKQLPNGTQQIQVNLGMPNEKIRPSIAVEGFKGKLSVEGTAIKMLELYEENRRQDPDLEFFRDWERVKEKITVRLMPGSFKTDLYMSAKEFGFYDLILVPYVDAGDVLHDGTHGSICVHKNHVRLWDVTRKEVFDTAIKNTKADVYQESMASFMQTVYPGMFDENMLQGPMIVSNREKAYGAAGIIGVIGKLKKSNTDGFYVIPSSIHEVLVVPKDRDKAEYDMMVSEVNATTVDPTEVLANHAYEF